MFWGDYQVFPMVCHLSMPAGGVTMKMAKVGLPAALKEKRQKLR